jgi:superfamily I DNA/RNA helicase
MAKRIEYLIEVDSIKKPFKILGLTFTNAAASEMRKRVMKEVPQAKKLVHITNFHSFAYSILKAYGNIIGIEKNFSIVSALDGARILKKILDTHHIHVKDYEKWKTEHILKCNFEEGFDEYYKVFRKYNETLLKENLLDYDNLLFYALNLLEDNPSVLNYYRATFRYILIDEYQDTNALQFKILSLLVKGYKELREFDDPNVFILADPNQAIFEFQGSDIRNITKAQEKFRCKKIKLHGEYRFSSKGISLLKKSISAFIDGETLKSETVDENPIYTIFRSKRDETQDIIKEIKEKKENGTKLQDIAILAPTAYYLQDIKRELKRNNVDYILINDFKGSTINKKRKYHKIFKILNGKSKNSDCSLSSIFEVICNAKGYDINNDEILSFLFELSKEYDSNPYKSNVTLKERSQSYINEVLLEVNWAEVMRKRIKNKVFLSSIHGSKGLEFDYIFICGLIKNLIPHKSFCRNCTGAIDYSARIENLKLLNVGTSRAKKELYLTSFHKNSIHETCIVKPFYTHLKIKKK